MRCIGLLALMIAVAVSACRSPPLVDRPDALGPSVVVRHVVEIDIEVPEEQAEDLESGVEMGRTVTAGGSPVSRTTRTSREQAGTALGPAPDEDGPDEVAVTHSRTPERTGGEEHLTPTAPPEPATATAPVEAQGGDLATLPGSPTRVSTESVGGERTRSGASTSLWLWATLAVLVVAAVLLVRRLRTRSRLRSRQFDHEDAWDVFQAGLARRPGEGM